MSAFRFPMHVDEITTDLLTAAITHQYPGTRVESFEVLRTEKCGDGFASTADRVVLALQYGDGGVGGLPSQVILKTMLLSPHAPRVMYETEVNFYQKIRGTLEIEAPASCASLFDPETGQFGILMEDLSARGARFPTAEESLSLEEVQGLVQNLARLHAHFWGSPRFSNDLSWVPTTCSGGMFDVFDQMGLALIEDQVEKNEFKQELIAPIGLSVSEMWDAMWKVERSFEGYQPQTLLHGDAHVANTYLLPDGQGGLLDWQLMVRGCWAHDLVYLVTTALETDMRRKHEREVLAGYLEALGSLGAQNLPGFEEAWKLYRQAILWGLVIGWLITPPTNYGVPITRSNISRLVNAVLDLESFSAVPPA